MKASFTVPGNPVAKPRQTRRDKWMKRPCVMRYRKWADQVKLCACGLVKNPVGIMVWVYFDFPKSYSASKRAQLKGQAHRIIPDGDNILKGLCDALLERDEGLSIQFIQKRWDDGKGARTEVILI